MSRNNPTRDITTDDGQERHMTRIGITCAVLAQQLQTYVTTQWQVVTRGRTDRGSVTIEQVIWAAAVIAIVAIVVTAITNSVTTKAGQIK